MMLVLTAGVLGDEFSYEVSAHNHNSDGKLLLNSGTNPKQFQQV